MSKKEKKGESSRLKKKDVLKSLIQLFEEHPGKDYDVKELFSLFHAKNHPAKMIVIDSLNELMLEDHIATDGQGK